MSSWAHTGNYELRELGSGMVAGAAWLAASDADDDDAQVAAELRRHREDAGRSPEALRVSKLGTRGVKSKAWRVLS